jgi:ABC-type Fe3+ transport system substrate-binding protein
VENAKREGELNLWSTTPDESVTPKILEAFNKRFDLKIKLNQTPMGSRDLVTRILAGSAAGKIEVDVGQGSSDSVAILAEKGLLEGFDWQGVFGKEFPEIGRRVQRVIPEFRGKVLDYWHLAYCILYRKDRLSEAQVPRTWEGLADAKWRNQVALNQEGTPFQYLAPFWGEARVLEIARKLKANQPIFARGAPGVAAAVESGEATLAITTVGQADFRRIKGAPLDWLTPSEIPIEIEHLIIPKGAPHPNLARLWGAWITTEGRPLFEDLSRNGLAWPDADSFLSRRLKQYGTKYVSIETKEQERVMAEARQKIVQIYLGK